MQSSTDGGDLLNSNSDLARSLKRVIDELGRLLDAHEESGETEPEDLVVPPIRGTPLHEAVKDLARYYPSKVLSHDAWVDWYGMIKCAHPPGKKNVEKSQRLALYDKFFQHRDALLDWTKEQLKAELKRSEPVYLNTEELAVLANVRPKTFSNAHAEARKDTDESKRPPLPAIPKQGNQFASFNYTAIWPWLLLKWPGRRAFFPESAAEARSLAQKLLEEQKLLGES